MFKHTKFDTSYESLSPMRNLLKNQREKYYFKGNCTLIVETGVKLCIIGLLRKKIKDSFTDLVQLEKLKLSSKETQLSKIY